jgi:hypothetical protein
MIEFYTTMRVTGRCPDIRCNEGWSTRCPAWQPRIASPIAKWVLPEPVRPRKITFSLPATKSKVARWAIRSRFSPRAWSKSNSSMLLQAGNRAARIRSRRRAHPGQRPRVAGRPPGIPHGSKILPGPSASRPADSRRRRIGGASTTAADCAPRDQGGVCWVHAVTEGPASGPHSARGLGKGRSGLDAPQGICNPKCPPNGADALAMSARTVFRFAILT